MSPRCYYDCHTKLKNVKASNNNDTSRKEYMFSFADMPRLVMYSATSGSEAWCEPHCVQSRFYSAGRMKYLRGPQMAAGRRLP